MKHKVLGCVSKSKVVGSDFGLLCIEGGFVAGQPTLVRSNARQVDQWSCQVNVDIGIDTNNIMRVSCLDFTGFVSIFMVDG